MTSSSRGRASPPSSWRRADSSSRVPSRSSSATGSAGAVTGRVKASGVPGAGRFSTSAGRSGWPGCRIEIESTWLASQSGRMRRDASAAGRCHRSRTRIAAPRSASAPSTASQRRLSTAPPPPEQPPQAGRQQRQEQHAQREHRAARARGHDQANVLRGPRRHLQGRAAARQPVRPRRTPARRPSPGGDRRSPTTASWRCPAPPAGPPTPGRSPPPPPRVRPADRQSRPPPRARRTDRPDRSRPRRWTSRAPARCRCGPRRPNSRPRAGAATP